MVALLRWKSSTCAKLASDTPPNLMKKEDVPAKRFTATPNSDPVSAPENTSLSAPIPETVTASSLPELLETPALLVVMMMLNITLLELALNKKPFITGKTKY